MRIEEERENIGDVMSNFDHLIDEGIEERLKEENVYGEYPACNFCGNVWYENDQFHCEIWSYGSYLETISANSLQEIMDSASDTYGSN